MVHSSKTEQLYANGCGTTPRGFVPGSPDATADFFSLFYQHCMYPTAKQRYLVEVANECNVKTAACNTTFENMIQQHIAVSTRLAQQQKHARKSGIQLPRAVVCGPTAAYPEYQLQNFTLWNNCFYG